jgi:deoxyribonuclease V
MTFEQMRAKQLEIAQKAVFEGSLEYVKRFVAVDMSAQSFYQGDDAPLFAAAVLLERGNPTPLEVATATMKPEIPYRTGFLTFREAPVILKALEKLQGSYDLIWCDGHGLMHPRRAGIATYLGVMLEKPALGVAKQPLTGKYEDVTLETGAREPVIASSGETLGFALRSRRNTKLIYVSPGHLCSVDSVLEFVLEHSDGFRIPYPTRLAHVASNEARKEAQG